MHRVYLKPLKVAFYCKSDYDDDDDCSRAAVAVAEEEEGLLLN